MYCIYFVFPIKLFVLKFHYFALLHVGLKVKGCLLRKGGTEINCESSQKMTVQKAGQQTAKILVGPSISVGRMTERWVTRWSGPRLSGGNSTMGGKRTSIHFSISVQISPDEVWNLFPVSISLTDTWGSAD